MRPRVYQFLAAAFLALCAVTPVTTPAQSQSGTPEAAAPERQAPSPQQGSPQPPTDGETRAAPNGEPDMQQGCPDQGRPLQLIV